MTHTERLINESRRSVAKCYATLLEVEAIHQNLSSACHEENQARLVGKSVAAASTCIGT
jgi:hypothetical protein